MAVINKSKLQQYLKLEYNVLLISLHGVGKTTIIKEVFTEAFGDRWKYFSASSLDPFVDFVGIPRVVENEDGRSVMKLVRPEFIEYDQVEAIFLDEFNRAAPKITNSVMELLQFKSINGHKLNNLKVIWCGINPETDEDTYSVNHLDPAQLDRFHVHYHIPYKLDEDYFTKKYPNTAPIFIQWWNDLPIDIRKMVSPRRVDYAADAHVKGCRLEDFLPIESNVSALRALLKSLPFHELIKNVKTDEEASIFVKDINNSTKLLDLVKANDAASIDFFVKYGSKIPKELVEPFAEFVYARKNGFDVVVSLEELIDKLPNDKGNQGTAALINNVKLDLLYKNGGSLENDIRALGNTKHNLVMKLSNRCCDVMISCQAETLQRIFWGVEGKVANRPTNFHQIVLILSKVGGFFTVKQKTYINTKLYTRKVVDDMNYI
jgi:hypothetical protein